MIRHRTRCKQGIPLLERPSGYFVEPRAYQFALYFRITRQHTVVDFGTLILKVDSTYSETSAPELHFILWWGSFVVVDASSLEDLESFDTVLTIGDFLKKQISSISK